jgi:hypothetical protein
MFRMRMRSVYVASGMIAVLRESFVKGSRSANAASDGIV